MSESLQGRHTTLFLLMGEFFGFSHTGATRCTNQAEIWQRSDSKKVRGCSDGTEVLYYPAKFDGNRTTHVGVIFDV